MCLQDVQALAAACCNAARVLHAAGLVYRDFKMDNIVQLQPGSYMVVDLEAVRKAGAGRLPAGFRLRGWGRKTLTRGQYTTLSDMYEIGDLMGQLLRALWSAPSAQATDFVDQLKNKALSAEDALQHAWLS